MSKIAIPHKHLRKMIAVVPLCVGILCTFSFNGHAQPQSSMTDEDILFGFGGTQYYSSSSSSSTSIPTPSYPVSSVSTETRSEPVEFADTPNIQDNVTANKPSDYSYPPKRSYTEEIVSPTKSDVEKATVPRAPAMADNQNIPQSPTVSRPLGDDNADYLPPVTDGSMRVAYAPVQPAEDLNAPAPTRAITPLSYKPDLIDVNRPVPASLPETPSLPSEGNFTLNNFVSYTLKANPTIELSRLQRDLQELLYEETEANQGFQVSGFTNLSSQYTSSDVNDSRFDNTTRGEAGLRINRILYSFGAGDSQLASSLTTAEQAAIEVKEQENTVAFDLATAYLEAVRQRELVEIEKYRLAEHEDFLGLVEKARQTDQVLKSQVFLARTGLAQRKQALLEAERQLKQLEYTLERYAHNNININDLTQPVIPIVVLPDEEEFVTQGIDLSPQIRALQKAVEAAEYAYQATAQSKYGSIDLAANVKGDKTTGETTEATVSTDAVIEYTVPFYTSGAQDSRLQQARVEVEQAQANLRFAKESLTEQLKLAYYVIESADEIRTLAKEEESNALQVLEAFRGEVQQGGRAFSDIIAQIDAVAAGRNRHISSQISKTLAAYAIMRHQGDLLYYLTKGN